MIHNAYDGVLHRSIRKHGAAAFVIEQIGAAVDYAALKEMERAAIQLYATLAPSGYNLTLGGDGQLGFNPGPEWRARNSAIHKGKIVSAETRAKMRAAKLGSKQGAAHIEAKAAARRGGGHSDEWFAKMRGQKRTPEARARMSAAQKGRTKSADHRAKLAAANRGKRHSAETRARMAAAHRRLAAEARPQAEAA